MRPQTNAKNAVRGFEVDTQKTTLAPGYVFVRQTPIGLLCVGMANDCRYLKTAFEDRRVAAILKRATEVIERQCPTSDLLPDVDDPYLRRLSLFARLSKDFNPDQPRDDHGRWTSEGTPAPSGAFLAPELPPSPSVLGAVARAVSSLLGRIPPGTLGALAQLGARLSAVTAILDIVLIPTNRSLITAGRLPDSDIRFSYDDEAGTLTLYRFDENRQRQILAEGKPDEDGIFHDDVGRPIGRKLDGSIVVDPDALTRGQLPAKGGDDEPQLCPAPVPDRPGAGNNKDAATYQAYVSTLINPEAPLPPGLAARLWDPTKEDWVYFDDCRRSDGTMIDAKYKYFRLLTSSSPPPQQGTEGKLLGQAQDQLRAADARSIEWHFAEKGAADYVEALFNRKEIPITIIWTPPPWTVKQLVVLMSKLVRYYALSRDRRIKSPGRAAHYRLSVGPFDATRAAGDKR